MGKVQLVDNSRHGCTTNYIPTQFIEVNELLSVRCDSKTPCCTRGAGKRRCLRGGTVELWVNLHPMDKYGLDGPKVPLVHSSLGPRAHALPAQTTCADIGVSCDELLDRLAATDRERNTSDCLRRAVSDDCARTGSGPKDVRDRIES